MWKIHWWEHGIQKSRQSQFLRTSTFLERVRKQKFYNYLLYGQRGVKLWKEKRRNQFYCLKRGYRNWKRTTIWTATDMLQRIPGKMVKIVKTGKSCGICILEQRVKIAVRQRWVQLFPFSFSGVRFTWNSCSSDKTSRGYAIHFKCSYERNFV
jgi:hypothetical protein